jgi:hypothetical protein
VSASVSCPMTTWNPAIRQMSATVRSGLRSKAAARSSRRESRYRCGLSLPARIPG